MSATKAAPQAFCEEPRPTFSMQPVESSQVKAIGYDTATRTLAVEFTRGTGALYCYPGVSPETHAAFIGAESIGTFFSQHIKPLPFKKYQPEPAEKAEA